MISFSIFLWLITLFDGGNISGSIDRHEPQVIYDKIQFKKIRGSESGGAVLGLGKQGAFDASWVTCPTVVWDGSQYKMWYSSVYDSKMGVGGIGLAISNDGVNWKRQNHGEQVLSTSAGNEFDNGQVMGPEVLRYRNGYKMWYTGMSKDWHKSGLGFYRIGLGVSQDGIKWKRENNGLPVVDIGVDMSFDNVQAATPSILKEGKIYKMWYAAWSSDKDKGHRICIASSKDGLKWSKGNDGKPIIGLNPEMAYGPAVVKYGDEYVLFYMSASKGLFSAKSKDGLHWTMLNDSKPVLTPGSGEDFDSLLVGHPFALIRDGKIMLWYTGYKRAEVGWKLSIGLAIQNI